MTPLSARIELWREGLLDPDEALDVAERVGGTADAAAAEVVELGAWRVPPPGFGIALAVGLPTALSGSSSVGVGERFTLHVARRPEPHREVVVVLRRTAGAWELLAGPVGLERLAVDADGHRLDLVARGPAGPQRWAVAVVPSDRVDEAAVQAAIATGCGSVGSVDVRVE